MTLKDNPPYNASRSQGAFQLLTAGIVLTGGTALIDPARLTLLFVPASFLILIFGTGALLGRTLGRVLPQSLEDSRKTPLLVLALRMGSGLACISFLATVSALSGMFRVSGVAAFFFLFYGLLRIFRSGFWRDIKPIQLGQNGLWNAAGGTLVGSAWLVGWLWATLPPNFYDELAYHLVIPQHALLSGDLLATPWVFFNMMPHASDVLLAWGMFFSGDIGTRATHFAIWMSCSIIAWGVAEAILRPRSSPLTGPLVAAALAASPTLWYLATLPFAGAFLCAAAGTAIGILFLPSEERRPWPLFGLALGMAMTAKLTGVYWFAAGLAAALVAGWPKGDIVRAGLVAAGCVAPWWGRAFFYTGNPIYPSAFEILGGRQWSETSQTLANDDVASGLMEMGLHGLLRLPKNMVMHPEHFGSGGDAGAMALVAIGGVFVWPVFTRLAGMSDHHRRMSDIGAVFTFVAGMGWLMTSATPRFLAPAIIIGLAGLVGATLFFNRAGKLLMVALILVSGLSGTWRFVSEHSTIFSSFNLALGKEDPEKYLQRWLDHYAAAEFVRKNLPKDARLLFIGETRPYYFFRDAVAPSAYDRHPLKRWVEESSSPDVLSQRLADENFTHVVINIREFKRLHETKNYIKFSGPSAEVHLKRLKTLPSRLNLLFSKNGVYVFEIPNSSAKKNSRSFAEERLVPSKPQAM